jgi:hypothetical protein
MAVASRLEAALEGPGQDPGVQAADGGLTVPCKVASVVWDDAQKRFARYSTLVYVLALLAMAGIVAAIVFFFAVDDKASAGVVSLISGLVTGTLAGFIKGERDTARTDRDKAGEIVSRECKQQSPEAVVRSLAP